MSEGLEISCADVQARLERGEPFLLLDCREQDEHVVAAIAGARLVPMSELVDRVGELAEWRDAAIVVHCHKGMRSLRVTNWLREQGFANVQSMAGGIDAWSVEIDPEVPRY
ncbi:MAG: rhodanese-like domain-containing protein [Bythopirellula sp.]|nr:rhodanese-like domain-containing protein [Bythopirellula sp.]